MGRNMVSKFLCDGSNRDATVPLTVTDGTNVIKPTTTVAQAVVYHQTAP
jgi:hypothetical protein